MANIEVASHKEEALGMLKKAKEQALEIIGLLAERHAKEDYCPVDTGRLRNSISHATDDDSAYIGTNVKYAPYVELGSSKRDPHPYLAPAVQNHMDEYKKVVETTLKS